MNVHILTALTVLLPLAASCNAQWSMIGGGGQRSGRNLPPADRPWYGDYGPDSPHLLWSLDQPTLVPAQPLLARQRIVTVRHTTPEAGPDDGFVAAYSIADGSELMTGTVPFRPGDGRMTLLALGYSLGTDLALVTRATLDHAAPLYTLDLRTGQIVWASTLEVRTDARGVGFGRSIVVISQPDRFDAIDLDDGRLLWSTPRTTSVGSHLGVADAPWVARFPYIDSFYAIDAVDGGHVVSKYAYATGARLYSSEVVSGDRVVYPPVVTPNLTIYFHSPSSAGSDAALFALEDTGTSIVTRWSAPSGAALGGESGLLSDGSIITVGVGGVLERRDEGTGELLARSGPLPNPTPATLFAIDFRNIVYFADTAAGTISAFDSGLNPWFAPVPHPELGGIAFDTQGRLCVTDRYGIYVYRNETPAPNGCPRCFADYDNSGTQDGDDVLVYLADWESGNICADVDRSGGIDWTDFARFFDYWSSGSCAR